MTLLSLASLIPGGLTHLSRDLLRAVGLEVPVPDHCAPEAAAADGPDWNRLGFPLLVWSNSELVQQEVEHNVSHAASACVRECARVDHVAGSGRTCRASAPTRRCC